MDTGHAATRTRDQTRGVGFAQRRSPARMESAPRGSAWERPSPWIVPSPTVDVLNSPGRPSDSIQDIKPPSAVIIDST